MEYSANFEMVDWSTSSVTLKAKQSLGKEGAPSVTGSFKFKVDGEDLDRTLGITVDQTFKNALQNTDTLGTWDEAKAQMVLDLTESGQGAGLDTTQQLILKLEAQDAWQAYGMKGAIKGVLESNYNTITDDYSVKYGITGTASLLETTDLGKFFAIDGSAGIVFTPTSTNTGQWNTSLTGGFRNQNTGSGVIDAFINNLRVGVQSSGTFGEDSGTASGEVNTEAVIKIEIKPKK
jgi:hypothetical protein